jgi:serine/threonine protein kinase
MLNESGGQATGAKPWPGLAPGTEVAGFTIEGLLASGSFGTVYRARRHARRFAIKLVLIDSRSNREADALRLMRHPNVVGFHGYGLWPEEEPRFLVLALELVEGRTLDVWAKEENPSALELVLQVLLPFALVLADVHAAGVVHRDVKEANIVMREEDGQPVLVDFGAAGIEGAPRLTLRLPPGTAEYRSPEVLHFAREWEGEPYPSSPGDDLWALGVVTYWLLTRTLPFGDRNSPGLVRAILEETPPAPHELNPRVPPALSELCMRMLEKVSPRSSASTIDGRSWVWRGTSEVTPPRARRQRDVQRGSRDDEIPDGPVPGRNRSLRRLHLRGLRLRERPAAAPAPQAGGVPARRRRDIRALRPVRGGDSRRKSHPSPSTYRCGACVGG